MYCLVVNNIRNLIVINLKIFTMKKLLFFLLISLTFNFAATAQTGDSWIKKIYNVLYMRDPNAFEYNIQNYNGGSWNNYDELQEYIKKYTSSLYANGINVKVLNIGSGKSVALVAQNGKYIAGNLITNDGGSIVAQGGGNIVAQGGGNLTNVAEIVAQGGGNLNSLKGLGFGGNYGTLAAGATRIPVSGKIAWIIK